MGLKIFAGIVGVVLLLLFVGPVVIKLRDVALTVVVLIGVVMMLVDVWQSLREKDE